MGEGSACRDQTGRVRFPAGNERADTMIFSRALANPWIRSLKERLRPAIRRLGVDVVAYDPGASVLARRMRLLRTHGIDLVFDIGANAGQYAAVLREAGFTGPIVSFEPLAEAFARLQQRAAGDSLWTCLNLAVSDEPGLARFHVDGADGQCSSFLEMVPTFERWLGPPHRHQSTREVEALTLDEAVVRYADPERTLFVKMDVQGFEGRILSATVKALDRIAGFQMELSLTPLYEGETPLVDMMASMRDKGYALESIEPGSTDAASGRLLQADCLFFRR